jgi:hypothetical protein
MLKLAADICRQYVMWCGNAAGRQKTVDDLHD